jgi:hypothetical protein
MAVSSTSVRGFKLRKDLRGNVNAGSIYECIIDNSITLTLGDAVRIDSSGYIKTAGTTGCILGILTGIVDQNGINVFEASRVPALSIAGSTLTGQDTIVTSATNTTNLTRVLRAQVTVDPAGCLVWMNQANATAALAQANLMSFYNLTAAGQIDSNSASLTSGQFQLIGLDPDSDASTAKGLFRLVQCELPNAVPVWGTTAVVAA